MNWDDVRMFLAVARSGQILAASRRLGLNHATVARRLTGLERTLKTSLLERSTSGCVLTPAGERFMTHAERMEAEMLSAASELTDTDIDVSGTVRIGAPDGFGVAFLAPRLGDLTARHPNLTVQLVPVPRSFSLSRREADIAITVDRPEHGRLIARKLVDYALGLYASADYLTRRGTPKTAAELRGHDLVGYVEDLLYSPSLNYGTEIVRDWSARFEIASALGQTEAVRAGAGIGILHAFIARMDASLVPVLPEIRIHRAYWMVTHESSRPLRHVSVVQDYLRDCLTRERAMFA
ncbi:LysR family transcriptional regulator [Polymorphum gilvum]|uniref:Probable transcriptional regulator protein, LysR family protein n=1 Tax=Polymorphum gilvum (strain LMG 25793 / CGMCC 1.9160 / SL003B-26A1) TaxID=991905 RepID=F2J6C6_POLGS|nr:LysR family transcriptional regulator [Polymorphum gilvum]ADZ71300.1 Probable transcriptional regulator protein, LysR family protein [Polymorphum gilvum SL003B-26A1]